MKKLVPKEFDVPQMLEGPGFRLRMLREADAEADYDAVMQSQQRLRAGSPHGWPRPGFTLEENRADLEKHEQEFIDRIAFAYTMLAADGSRVLGCVYLNPSEEADADVYMWVRDDSHQELTRPLFETVDVWLRECWPFAEVNYIRTIYYRVAEDWRCS